MEVENEELQELTEFRPSIGGEYESQDARGHWWDIVVTAENTDGTYCADVKDGHSTSWKKVHASNIIEKPPSTNDTRLWHTLAWICFDLSLCALVYCWTFDMLPVSHGIKDYAWYVVLACSLCWRFPLCKKRELPFSCVRMEVAQNRFGHDVDVYVVGTMHVSPGSVTDTKEVIDKVQPDIIMIELDRERLRDMKADLANGCEVERFEHELQVDERAIVSVHAEWNGSCVDGSFGAYPTFAEGDNPYGDKRASSLPNEHVYICRRSSTSMYTQTVWAQKRGACGVVIIDDESQPAVGLVSAGGICRSLQNFLQTRTVAMPSIPTFLVKEEIGDGALVETFLKPNEVPQPYSFWKKLCRVCIMTVSGIGILYGIIRQAGVKVGHEFLTADAEAEKLGRPCVCIDISVSNLGAKLKKEITPYPSNVLNTVLFLFALPRMLFYRVLFPFRDLDLVAAMLWAFARFKPRTWLAFVVAAGVASVFVGLILMIPGLFVKAASDHFAPDSHVGSNFERYFPLACELYLFPAIYRGLLDQRDEEMYRGIASQVRRRRNKRTFVAVVGAGHVNGIVARARNRGL